ncbi:hypothetical protein BD324DRAFT_648971 [Kockovaella imperatae]|uniref:Uncharacterized protein n=1 Tax=Kockovaella imperatae TaxID=4999 RepID=A0A1Y1ULE3_9TREE|nr:hypothetical protein BD324DRAFT_648971 [Kockovaella imperatae]ORX38861.1 hypothetical protein BD324DRAFT_648971 [Kockovaella imperatae]
MVFVKRKPVIYYPLPSLAEVLQPVQPAQTNDSASASSPAPYDKADKSNEQVAELAPLPPDGKNEEEQMDKLLTVFRGDFPGASGNVGPGKGKRAGVRVLNHHLNNGAAASSPANGSKVNESAQDGEAETGDAGPITWRIWDRESFFIPATGEIFTDYETFLSRMTFYQQPLFQCEVSGKSGLTYSAAQASEWREARQLHTRFPKQLKKAVLIAIQFQIEGKLDTLADKIFERYVNRFFDEECVFVDVEGDKYLARIVKTFPPRSLAASTSSSPVSSLKSLPRYHPYAADLNLSLEEANEKDDPMAYFYNVRLLEEGAPTDHDQAQTKQHTNSDDAEEQWQGSTMEVRADKISRDRINFSRVMLKRFIRDCVYRDPAIFSPWVIKPAVAARYDISTEMPSDVGQRIQRFKEELMDKRKRARDEKLGIVEEEKPTEEDIKPKTKKQRLAEERRLREEEKAREEALKKKPMKFPAEDLLVEYSQDKDEPAGRVEVRPTPNRDLPFGDLFEKFLMSWSFLNVMGKPLALSPFTLDDYEQALYHTDPWTSPTKLMVEIHSTLLNALIVDQNAGNEAVKPLSLTGRTEDNDTDYWEGKKGATAELLRPAASDYASNWKTKELSIKESRKGWENALVGCLWERATLDTLPNYLDNILHLTFEDKPAPTRPTWSTGPATAASGHGLIPSKPEKRYSTLHHVHKLEIISFLIELVAQTASIRDFMEQSTTDLTEVRKNIIDVKREQRQLRAERAALDPPTKPKLENGEPVIDANGDVVMSDAVKEEERDTPAPSVNGVANGTTSNATDRDELESSIGPAQDDEDSDSFTEPALSEQEDGPIVAAAHRRKAMKEKAAEREAEEANRAARAAEDRLKSKENKHIASEKRRLQDEIDSMTHKLRLLDHDFRSHLQTLRARPLGSDRFGNKVWWLDGLGSAPLMGDNGKVTYGTGRLYLQGADDIEVEFCRIPAEMSETDCEARRAKEEGDGRLSPGEWAMYDSPESFAAFMSWLNPRGIRELALLKVLQQWQPEIEGGMRKRRIAVGLDTPPETGEEPARRARPVRKVAAAGGDDETSGYLAWRNRRAV